MRGITSGLVNPFPRLFAIIDAAQIGERPPLAVLEILISVGVKLVQYRDKHASSRALFENGRPMATRARQGEIIFVVNDRADVALAIDADAVHLGQEDLPVELARRGLPRPTPIGCSAPEPSQAA